MTLFTWSMACQELDTGWKCEAESSRPLRILLLAALPLEDTLETFIKILLARI